MTRQKLTNKQIDWKTKQLISVTGKLGDQLID